MRAKILGGLAGAMLAVCGAVHAQTTPKDVTPPKAGPPALGLLVPRGPADYAPIYDAMTDVHDEMVGPFAYRTGKIGGVAVVVSVAPQDGPVMRSVAAQAMVQHYDIKALLYPGTSGAHLGADQMRLGDIVLGAANVNFGDFFMDKRGEIIGNEFGHEAVSAGRYGPFYMEPKLLGQLACSAQRAAAQTTLPAWLNPPSAPRAKPDIFYYGVQGTSTMWLANPAFMDKLDAVFHAVDEDGDWYSNLVAAVNDLPFIEVSVISDSIKAFPETERGLPIPPAGETLGASRIAQRLADAVMLDFIRKEGAGLIATSGHTLLADPYPKGAFEAPKTPPAGLNCG